MEETYYDSQTRTLKNPIDLNDLRNNQEKGVIFELEEEDAPPEFETSNTYFDKEAVAENLYHPDDSDNESGEDDDCTPFERMAKKMEDICPAKDGGIMKRILKQGSGPVVPLDSVVRVHYSGFQEYADEPFDSTRLQNCVKKFRVGQGEVIEGFDVGVSTMRKGELSRFLIKPEYGFGDYGSPPRIPAEATVLFEIELLSFVEHAGLDDYFIMNQDEKRQVPFADLKKVYSSVTKEAKQLFDSKQIKHAFAKYKRAMALLEDHPLKNAEEEQEQQKLLLKVCLNTALCCVKLCHSGRAIVYCKKALEIDNKSVKALYLFGKALHQLSEFQRAREYLIRAQRIKPQDKDINEELEKLNKNMKTFKIVEKQMYQQMFSNPQGQSEEEMKAEEQRHEEMQAKAEKCTPEFEKMVKEKLQEFKEDKDVLEFPMPSYNFTNGEIACIIETAEDLGLQHKVRGSGQNAQLKILKRKPEPN